MSKYFPLRQERDGVRCRGEAITSYIYHSSMKLIVSILFIIISVAHIHAQEIKGRVINELGKPAGGVRIKLNQNTASATSDAQGKFKVGPAKVRDTLFFISAGFEPYKVIINQKIINDTSFEVVLLTKRKTVVQEVTLLNITPGHPRSDADKIERSLFFPDSFGTEDRDGILAKSRILTAGEINDFAKWKMWTDYTENEFKQWSKYWNITPGKRFTVQVGNRNKEPVIDHAVYLIRTGSTDTIWTARTDNTGKAELWADYFSSGGKNDQYYISDENGQVIQDPISFSNGINHLVIDKACSNLLTVDISFVVDATGSMGDEIEFLKLELEDVIRNCMDKYSSLSLKASSVFYRDKGDEYIFRRTPFNEDLLKTLNFIKLQRALAGGDFPESVDVALENAIDSLDWDKEARARLLFLILDAPPHEEAKAKIQLLISKAAQKGIRIIPLACSGTDKSTEFLLRSMALATNGTYTFLTNNSGVGKPHMEPTTDKYEVQLLNTLLQDIVSKFLYAPECDSLATSPPVTYTFNNPSSLKFIPDRSYGKYVIEVKSPVQDIFITDYTGKILFRLPKPDSKNMIRADLQAYPSGLYLVRYITPENKWRTDAIMLAH